MSCRNGGVAGGDRNLVEIRDDVSRRIDSVDRRTLVSIDFKASHMICPGAQSGCELRTAAHDQAVEIFHGGFRPIVRPRPNVATKASTIPRTVVRRPLSRENRPLTSESLPAGSHVTPRLCSFWLGVWERMQPMDYCLLAACLTKEPNAADYPHPPSTRDDLFCPHPSASSKNGAVPVSFVVACSATVGRTT